MKAIMISIKPKWCAEIMNGDKTIEVRTSKSLYKAIQKLIDENGYADIYWYCSMAKHIKDYLQIENGKYVCNVPKDYERTLNGKVIFKFRCYKVEEINYDHDEREEWYATKTLTDKALEKRSCLSYEDLDDYLKGKGYAIHIRDLEIFDKPKELGEFYNIIPSKLPLTRDIKYLTKAPQSFCYVEELL